MAKRPSIWDDDTKPYGTYGGPAQDARDWASAFSERMGLEEAEQVIGAQSAWSILGIKPGASLGDIVTAFRKLAFETHPDHGGDAEQFMKVRAAYTMLMENVK